MLATNNPVRETLLPAGLLASAFRKSYGILLQSWILGCQGFSVGKLWW